MNQLTSLQKAQWAKTPIVTRVKSKSGRTVVERDEKGRRWKLRQVDGEDTRYQLVEELPTIEHSM